MMPANNVNRTNIQNKKPIVYIIDLLENIDPFVLNEVAMVRPQWHI
jgi:hypothetical protein